MILRAEFPEAGYGKKVVLRNIKLHIEAGEIVALIGPNGAGKSTLLKVLMGIVKVPTGSISLNGSIIMNNNPEVNVRNGLSLVPQGNRVFTELTVQENLEVGGYLVRDKAQLKERIESVLAIFPDLKSRIKQDAGKLSGGEKQQLALARALVLNPRILLLDEPSLGLAPKLVTQAFGTLKNINQQFHTTILIVEQKVLEVLKIAHRVYALRMGEIAFCGTPETLTAGETLKKIFLV